MEMPVGEAVLPDMRMGDDMTPAEEIRTQREAILAGEWVKVGPGTGQACLVERIRDDELWTCLSLSAMKYVQEAIWVLHPETSSMGTAPWEMTTRWNDHICPDEHTALTVLEYAGKLAEIDQPCERA